MAKDNKEQDKNIKEVSTLLKNYEKFNASTIKAINTARSEYNGKLETLYSTLKEEAKHFLIITGNSRVFLGESFLLNERDVVYDNGSYVKITERIAEVMVKYYKYFTRSESSKILRPCNYRDPNKLAFVEPCTISIFDGEFKDWTIMPFDSYESMLLYLELNCKESEVERTTWTLV